MPSIQITVPNDKGSQKFTIGEIARMILETHESSPAVDAQTVITDILNGLNPGEEEEIVFLTAAGPPYKSWASATRAARTRADLQDIVWEIVSVDGGWVIRDITTYANWFEYWANKETMTAHEIGYTVLVSAADMTRFCRSTVYRKWASQLGLGVPVMFGGEGTSLAKEQEDAPAQSLPPHDEPDPQTDAENVVPQYDARERELPAEVTSASDLDAANRATPEGHAADRRPGFYSSAKLRAWYIDYVKACKADGKSPSRTDDVKAARAPDAMGEGVTRDAVWNLRNELAPEKWKKPGRPRK